MKLTSDMIPALLDDFETASSELKTLAERHADRWTLGPERGWTAAQHVAHVATALEVSATSLENAAAKLRSGILEPRPWRDPLQAWFVALATGRRFPRGARSPQVMLPAAAPGLQDTLRRLRAATQRHRALAENLTANERARIWFPNPYIRLRWYYTLPEILRVQTNHTRHHVRGAAQAMTVDQAVAAG